MTRAMKDSGQIWLGDIPEHWKTLRLKSVFNRRTQKNNPVISTERLSLSIDKGVTLYADKTTNLDRFKDDFTQYQLAYPNDIVLNCMNMIVGAIGLSKYFGCVSPVYYVIYPKNENISVHFYSYLLNISSIKDLYRSLGQGIYAIDRGDGRVNTCRLKVSYDDFGKIEIPFPPTLEEQQAIANFLDLKCAEVDEMIALQEKIIDELKLYKLAVITQAVTKGLNPHAPMKDSGMEWIGQIPQHWDIVQFKRCMRIYNGRDYKNIETEEGYPVIGSGGIFTQASDYIYDGEVLLLGRKGTINKPLHYTGKFWTVDTMFYSIPLKENMCKYHYYQAYTFPYGMYSTSTALPSMTSSALSNNIICKPPYCEQQAIVNFLDQKCTEIDELTNIKKQKIDELKEYKKSIIYEYVTGKKQVKYNSYGYYQSKRERL